MGRTLAMSDTTTTPKLSVSDVAAHLERGDVFLLDVRGSTGKQQIYGAINYDPKKLRSASKLVLPLPKSDGLIVLYDASGDSRDLETIAEKLRADGYASIYALEGGFDAWDAAGGRIEEATIEQPVPLVSEHQIAR